MMLVKMRCHSKVQWHTVLVQGMTQRLFSASKIFISTSRRTLLQSRQSRNLTGHLSKAPFGLPNVKGSIA